MCASGCPYPVEGLKFGLSSRSDEIYLGDYDASAWGVIIKQEDNL